MTEAIRQQECLNTLKTFNNTVVTIRLYPANAPQISNAIERGYKTVKQYLRQYGIFTFGLRGNEPELCGDILDPQVTQSISNLIVFRHLSLLQMDRFSFVPGLDRAQFKKILDIFSAKVDQIRQEGGGWAFAGRLGIDGYFSGPQVEEEKGETSAEEEAGAVSRAEKLEVRKELVDVLFGRERRPNLITELTTVLGVPAAGAPIVTAAVQGVMEGMVQKKLFIASTALEQIMENCGALISAELATGLLSETAALLLKSSELPSLVLLMLQNPQGNMGALLSRSLERQISMDLFASVIRDLRQIASQLRVTQARDAKQLQFIEAGIDRLLATSRGKQFLGQEKAKSIIEAGEKVRRARRVEAGVKALLKGNDEVLQSDEFTVHLPFVLQKMEAEGLEREVRVILNKLSMLFLQGDGDTRNRLIRSISQIAENLAAQKHFQLLELISGPLLYWLKSSENGDFLYEKVCLALHGLMSYAWQNDKLELGDEILSLLYQLRSGAVRRPAAVRAIVGRAQDKGLDRGLMAHLLDQCLAAPNDEILSRRLILQGPVVSRFLVDSLVRADEARDRVKIMDLLTYGEQFLPPILVEKLAEPMPWYGKRNLLKLLADTGSVENLEVVYPFLRHDDLRVQREAFNCLYKISGNKRKEALLRALNEVGEVMKLQVVRALIPFGDAEVAAGLGQLLEEHRFYSDDYRDTLLTNVCLAISRCPYPHAERVLQGFLAQKGQRGARKIGAKVWEAAEEALDQAIDDQQGERQLQVKAGQLRKSVLSKVGGKPGPTEKKLITGLSEERAIRELVDDGEKDKARAQILDLITKIARLRRFTQAEQLREWLIEIDSLALTDIIKAAEIIEEEKHAAVDREHLEIWSGLFDVLTTEEFSAFYHALQHKRYQNEEVIIKKGAIQNSLFFINSGKVKLYFMDRDRDVLVKVLESGKILGIGSFFDASVWTLSAAALGQADISVLQFEKMKSWHEMYPALESKLHDFCLKYKLDDDLFQNPEKDRRRFQRFKTPALLLSITLLADDGRSAGVTVKGELADLSLGGGSFNMRISKKENARLLLGRHLNISLPMENEDTGRPIVFGGVIVAVRALHTVEYEYSVHVGFDSVIESGELEQVLRLL